MFNRALAKSNVRLLQVLFSEGAGLTKSSLDLGKQDRDQETLRFIHLATDCAAISDNVGPPLVLKRRHLHSLGGLIIRSQGQVSTGRSAAHLVPDPR